jgi:hypothetical protein
MKTTTMVVVRQGTKVAKGYMDDDEVRSMLEMVAAGLAGGRGPWRGTPVGLLPFLVELVAIVRDGRKPTYSISAIQSKAGRWTRREGITIPDNAFKPKQIERAIAGDYSIAQSWKQNLTRWLCETGIVESPDGIPFAVVSVAGGLVPAEDE